MKPRNIEGIDDSLPTFRTPRWFASAHLQTLGASLPLWAPPKSFRAEGAETLQISLPEGGALNAVAWWYDRKPRLTAILVHGVGGSIESKYMMRGAVAMHRAGLHVVRLDLRGAGAGVATAPSLAHAGLTADPQAAIDALARDPRVEALALVGFSLGGHVSLRLAGEWGGAPHSAVRAVVAISAPVDLTAVSHALETKRTLPYRAYVLRALARQGRAFAQMHPDKARYDTRTFWRMRKIREYDAHVVAPMHGFTGADDYYTRASAGPWLPKIQVPTWMVHADDDPMVPLASIQPWLSDAAPALRFVRSARGGHVGWFGGLSEESFVGNWAIERTIEFIKRA